MAQTLALLRGWPWEVWGTLFALFVLLILLVLRPPNGGAGSGD
jgi:hypothetical protein